MFLAIETAAAVLATSAPFPVVVGSLSQGQFAEHEIVPLPELRAPPALVPERAFVVQLAGSQRKTVAYYYQL